MENEEKLEEYFDEGFALGVNKTFEFFKRKIKEALESEDLESLKKFVE